MFIRAPNSGRKLLLTCIVAGVMIAILVSCLQFLVAWHKHEVKYDDTELPTYKSISIPILPTLNPLLTGSSR